MIRFSYDGEKFIGFSKGSIETCIGVPRFGLVFDIGKAHREHIQMRRLLLSHGHLDHSAGLAYYISQRNLRKLPPPHIYVPKEIFSNIQTILNEHSKIEQYEMEYSLHANVLNQEIALEDNFWFSAIPAYHRIPACGYLISQRRTKLNAKYLHLEPLELQRIKQNPESKEYKDTFFISYVPYICYSGDTTIEFLSKNPQACQSKILFLECTFIDDVRSIDETRYWGHIHLDEIANQANLLKDVKQLYLIHCSPRYSPKAIATALKEKLPDWLYAKTQALGLL